MRGVLEFFLTDQNGKKHKSLNNLFIHGNNCHILLKSTNDWIKDVVCYSLKKIHSSICLFSRYLWRFHSVSGTILDAGACVGE